MTMLVNTCLYMYNYTDVNLRNLEYLFKHRNRKIDKVMEKILQI